MSMAKPVLCLGSLVQIDEDTPQIFNARRELPGDTVKCKPASELSDEVETCCSSAQGDELGEPMQRGAPPLSTAMGLTITQKNTFIHFDIPSSPSNEREMPTNSAPGVMLRRLFRTKAQDAPRPETSTADCAIVKSTMNDDTIKVDTFKVEPEQNFSRVDSESSTVEPDSFANSPTEKEGENSTISEQFNLTAEKMEVELHKSGSCTPCNYFQYKVDGCRLAESCPFCHLCPKGEVKKRKKDKLKELKAAGVVRAKERPKNAEFTTK